MYLSVSEAVKVSLVVWGNKNRIVAYSEKQSVSAAGTFCEIIIGNGIS